MHCLPWVTGNRLLLLSKREPGWGEHREAAFLQCAIPKCVQVKTSGHSWLLHPLGSGHFAHSRGQAEPPGAAVRGKAGKEVQAGPAGLLGMASPDADAAGAGEPTLSPLPAPGSSSCSSSFCPCSHSSQLCLSPGLCWRVLLGIPSTPRDTKAGRLGLTCVTASAPADLASSPHSPANTAQLLERSHFASPGKAEGNGISPPALGEIPLSCRQFLTSLLGNAGVSVNAWLVAAGHGCTRFQSKHSLPFWSHRV